MNNAVNVLLLLGTSLGFLGALYAIYLLYKNIINLEKEKKYYIGKKLNSLEEDFFVKIKYHILFGHEYKNINDPAKKIITENMMKSKLFVWFENYRKMLKEIDKTSSFSYKTIDLYINKIVVEYNYIWEKELLIPSYILEKFNDEHEEKVNFFKKKMKYVFIENKNKNNHFFVRFFLKESMVLLDDTIKDIESTINKATIKNKDKNYNKKFKSPMIYDFSFSHI